MTILEKKGTLSGLKIAYVGDGNNVAHSLIVGAAKLGLHIASLHRKDTSRIKRYWKFHATWPNL